jgi:hypothetical protein
MPMSECMDSRDNQGAEITRVSPELALVDPDLASRLQRWLPTRRPQRPPLPSLGVQRMNALAADADSA